MVGIAGVDEELAASDAEIHLLQDQSPQSPLDSRPAASANLFGQRHQREHLGTVDISRQKTTREVARPFIATILNLSSSTFAAIAREMLPIASSAAPLFDVRLDLEPPQRACARAAGEGQPGRFQTSIFESPT